MSATKKPCTAPHATLKSDRSLWSSLELVGIQRIPADATGPAEELEVRNCGCGSTLYLNVAG